MALCNRYRSASNNLRTTLERQPRQIGCHGTKFAPREREDEREGCGGIKDKARGEPMITLGRVAGTEGKRW
ncbi:hypothetical protein GCM10009646_84890 [Streptomyces aureus]